MNFQRPSGGTSNQRNGSTIPQAHMDSEEDPSGVCGEKELLLLSHASVKQFKNDHFSYNGQQMTVLDLIIATGCSFRGGSITSCQSRAHIYPFKSFL